MDATRSRYGSAPQSGRLRPTTGPACMSVLTPLLATAWPHSMPRLCARAGATMANPDFVPTTAQITSPPSWSIPTAIGLPFAAGLRVSGTLDRQNAAPGRPPQDELLAPLRRVGRHERVVIAPNHALEHRLRQYDREECRLGCRGNGMDGRPQIGEMRERKYAQLVQSGAQAGRRLDRENLLGVDQVSFQQVERNIELPSRRVDRQRANEAGDRVDHAGV